MRRGIILVLVTGAVTSVWPAARDATATPGTGWTGKDRVQAAVKVRAEPFRLQDVRLLAGPFRHAQELNRKYLLSLEPDRLLHSFRLAAGLPSQAQPYGGPRRSG